MKKLSLTKKVEIKQVSVRVPLKEYARLARAAKLHKRSISAEAVFFIERCLDTQGEQKATVE